MPVFISYYRADETKARTIETYFRRKDIPAYLDVLDSGLRPADATARILEAISNCTHLLALVSGSTVKSWWVPFEIGVATDSSRRIASFREGQVQLPDFLNVWPILSSLIDLELFAARYKQDALPLSKARRTIEAKLAQIQKP